MQGNYLTKTQLCLQLLYTVAALTQINHKAIVREGLSIWIKPLIQSHHTVHVNIVITDCFKTRCHSIIQESKEGLLK